jgi:hypothetical protein
LKRVSISFDYNYNEKSRSEKDNFDDKSPRIPTFERTETAPFYDIRRSTKSHSISESSSKHDQKKIKDDKLVPYEERLNPYTIPTLESATLKIKPIVKNEQYETTPSYYNKYQSENEETSPSYHRNTEINIPKYVKNEKYPFNNQNSEEKNYKYENSETTPSYYNRYQTENDDQSGSYTGNTEINIPKYVKKQKYPFNNQNSEEKNYKYENSETTPSYYNRYQTENDDQSGSYTENTEINIPKYEKKQKYPLKNQKFEAAETTPPYYNRYQSENEEKSTPNQRNIPKYEKNEKSPLYQRNREEQNQQYKYEGTPSYNRYQPEKEDNSSPYQRNIEIDISKYEENEKSPLYQRNREEQKQQYKETPSYNRYQPEKEDKSSPYQRNTEIDIPKYEENEKSPLYQRNREEQNQQYEKAPLYQRNREEQKQQYKETPSYNRYQPEKEEKSSPYQRNTEIDIPKYELNEATPFYPKVKVNENEQSTNRDEKQQQYFESYNNGRPKYEMSVEPVYNERHYAIESTETSPIYSRSGKLEKKKDQNESTNKVTPSGYNRDARFNQNQNEKSEISTDAYNQRPKYEAKSPFNENNYQIESTETAPIYSRFKNSNYKTRTTTTTPSYQYKPTHNMKHDEIEPSRPKPFENNQFGNKKANYNDNKSIIERSLINGLEGISQNNKFSNANDQNSLLQNILYGMFAKNFISPEMNSQFNEKGSSYSRDDHLDDEYYYNHDEEYYEQTIPKERQSFQSYNNNNNEMMESYNDQSYNYDEYSYNVKQIENKNKKRIYQKMSPSKSSRNYNDKRSKLNYEEEDEDRIVDDSSFSSYSKLYQIDEEKNQDSIKIIPTNYYARKKYFKTLIHH